MKESVYNTAAYFKYDYEDNWIIDPAVKEIKLWNLRKKFMEFELQENMELWNKAIMSFIGYMEQLRIRNTINPEIIITEDSNSGYQFFNQICEENELKCESMKVY